MQIKLGQEVKDKVTGFSGIATSVTEFMYGCRRISVDPRELSKDGKLKENLIFDEPQLEVIGNGLLPAEEPESKEGTKHNHGDPAFRPTKHSMSGRSR